MTEPTPAELEKIGQDQADLWYKSVPQPRERLNLSEDLKAYILHIENGFKRLNPDYKDATVVVSIRGLFKRGCSKPGRYLAYVSVPVVAGVKEGRFKPPGYGKSVEEALKHLAHLELGEKYPGADQGVLEGEHHDVDEGVLEEQHQDVDQTVPE